MRGSRSNRMMKLDTHDGKDDSRAMLTGLSAALGLWARMANNCSVDNHSALGACFYHQEQEKLLLLMSLQLRRTREACGASLSAMLAQARKAIVYYSKRADRAMKKTMEKEKL